MNQAPAGQSANSPVTSQSDGRQSAEQTPTEPPPPYARTESDAPPPYEAPLPPYAELFGKPPGDKGPDQKNRQDPLLDTLTQARHGVLDGKLTDEATQELVNRARELTVAPAFLDSLRRRQPTTAGPSGSPAPANTLDPAAVALADRARLDKPTLSANPAGSAMRTAIVGVTGDGSRPDVDGAFSDENVKNHFIDSLDGWDEEIPGFRISVRLKGLGPATDIHDAKADRLSTHESRPVTRTSVDTRDRVPLNPTNLLNVPVPGFGTVGAQLSGVGHQSAEESTATSEKRRSVEIRETDEPTTNSRHDALFDVTVTPTKGKGKGKPQSSEVTLNVALDWSNRRTRAGAPRVSLSHSERVPGESKAETNARYAAEERVRRAIRHVDFAGTKALYTQVVTYYGLDPADPAVKDELWTWLESLDQDHGVVISTGGFAHETFNFKRRGPTKVTVGRTDPIDPATGKRVPLSPTYRGSSPMTIEDKRATSTSRTSKHEDTNETGFTASMSLGDAIAGIVGAKLGFGLTTKQSNVDAWERVEGFRRELNTKTRGDFDHHDVEFRYLVTMEKPSDTAAMESVDGGHRHHRRLSYRGSVLPLFVEGAARLWVAETSSLSDATKSETNSQGRPKSGMRRDEVLTQANGDWELDQDTELRLTVQLIERLAAEGAVESDDLSRVKDDFETFLEDNARALANGGDWVRFPLPGNGKDLFLRGDPRADDGTYHGTVQGEELSGKTTVTMTTQRDATRDRERSAHLTAEGDVEPVSISGDLAVSGKRSRGGGITETVEDEHSWKAEGPTHKYRIPLDFQARLGLDLENHDEPLTWTTKATKATKTTKIEGKVIIGVSKRPGQGVDPGPATTESETDWLDISDPNSPPLPRMEPAELPAEPEVEGMDPIRDLGSTITKMLTFQTPEGSRHKAGEKVKGLAVGSRLAPLGTHEDGESKKISSRDQIEQFSAWDERQKRLKLATGPSDQLRLTRFNDANILGLGSKDLVGTANLTTALGNPRILDRDDEHKVTQTRHIQTAVSASQSKSVGATATAKVSVPVDPAGKIEPEASAGYRRGPAKTVTDTVDTVTGWTRTERCYLVEFDALHTMDTSVHESLTGPFGGQHPRASHDASRSKFVPRAVKVWVPASQLPTVGTFSDHDVHNNLHPSDRLAYERARSAPAQSPTGQPAPNPDRDVPGGIGDLAPSRSDVIAEFTTGLRDMMRQWEAGLPDRDFAAKYEKLNDSMVADFGSQLASRFDQVTKNMFGEFELFGARTGDSGKLEMRVGMKARLVDSGRRGADPSYTHTSSVTTTKTVKTSNKPTWTVAYSVSGAPEIPKLGNVAGFFLDGAIAPKVGGSRERSAGPEHVTNEEHTTTFTWTGADMYGHSLQVDVTLHPWARSGDYRKRMLIPGLRKEPVTQAHPAGTITVPDAVREAVPSFLSDKHAPVRSADGSVRTKWGPGKGFPDDAAIKALPAPNTAPELQKTLHKHAGDLNANRAYRMLVGNRPVQFTDHFRDTLSPGGYVVDVGSKTLSMVTIRTDLGERELIGLLPGAIIGHTVSSGKRTDHVSETKNEAGVSLLGGNAVTVLGDMGKTTERTSEKNQEGRAAPTTKTTEGPSYLVRADLNTSVTLDHRKGPPTEVDLGHDGEIWLLVDEAGLDALGLAAPTYEQVDVPVGVFLKSGEDTQFTRAVGYLPSRPGEFGVVKRAREHGGPDLSADELATVIRDSQGRPGGWNGTDPVRLYVCDTGNLGVVAQELSDLLGVPVIRPTGTVWLGPQTGDAALVVTNGFTADGRPKVRRDGAWVEHRPNSAPTVTTVASYDSRIPPKTPRGLGLDKMEHLASNDARDLAEADRDPRSFFGDSDPESEYDSANDSDDDELDPFHLEGILPRLKALRSNAPSTYDSMVNRLTLLEPTGFAWLDQQQDQAPDHLAKDLALLEPIREHVQQAENRSAKDIEVYTLITPAPRSLSQRVRQGQFGHASVAVRIPGRPDVIFGYYPVETPEHRLTAPFVEIPGTFRSPGISIEAAGRIAESLGPYRINADQLADAYRYATEHLDTRYNALRNNCATFARGFLQAAEQGVVPKSPRYDTPNALASALAAAPPPARAESDGSITDFYADAPASTTVLLDTDDTQAVLEDLGSSLHLELSRQVLMDEPYTRVTVTGYSNSRLHANSSSAGRAESVVNTIRDALHAENDRQLAAGVPRDQLPDVERVRFDIVPGARDAQPRTEGPGTAADRRRAVLVEFTRPDPSRQDVWTPGRLRDRVAGVRSEMDALRADMTPDEKFIQVASARQELARAHDFTRLRNPNLFNDLTDVMAHVLTTEGPEAARRFAADTARDLGTEGTSLRVRAGAGPESESQNPGGGSDRGKRPASDVAGPSAKRQAVPSPAVRFGPSPHATGGVGFSSDPATTARWRALYTALPSTPGETGRQPFYVFADVQDGRFVVDGQPVDGAGLADRVARSDAYRAAAAADPNVSVVVLAVDPSRMAEFGVTAREFAETLRGDGPYRRVAVPTQPVVRDPFGQAYVANGGQFRVVSRFRAVDLDLTPLHRADGREFGMGFTATEEAAAALRRMAWNTTDFADRTVAVEGTGTDGQAQWLESVQEWAPATDGDRARPVVLHLESQGGQYVSRRNGRTVLLDPEAAADVLVETGFLQRADANGVRPPLVLVTRVPGAPQPFDLNARLLNRLKELTGPRQTFDHSGRVTFLPEMGIVGIEAGGEFRAGQLGPGDVEYSAYGSVFDFHGSGEVAGQFAAEVAVGTADVEGPWGDREPVFVSVDSVAGDHARIRLPGGHLAEVGGRELGRLLLADPRFKAQLAADPSRPVVLVGNDAGALPTVGGFGYEFAGALRENGLFPDVYAANGDAWLEPSGLGRADDTTFPIVSVWRAGDVRVEPLYGPDGRLVMMYFRSPDDERKLAELRRWVRDATPESLSNFVDADFVTRESPWNKDYPPVLIVAEATENGYTVVRDDGRSGELPRAAMPLVLRENPVLRAGMGRNAGQGGFVLPDPSDDADTARFADEMLLGGYSRWVFGPASPLRFLGGGRLAMEGSEFTRKDPLLPTPDQLLSYPFVDALGPRGQFFPTRELDAVLTALALRNRAANPSDFYVRELPDGRGGTRRVAFKLPWTGRAWEITGHAGRHHLTHSIRTTSRFERGDKVYLGPKHSARAVYGSKIFREASPSEDTPIVYVSCLINSPYARPDQVTFAFLVKGAWKDDFRLADVWASDDLSSYTRDTGYLRVADGGSFDRARAPEEPETVPVPFGDPAVDEAVANLQPAITMADERPDPASDDDSALMSTTVPLDTDDTLAVLEGLGSSLYQELELQHLTGEPYTRVAVTGHSVPAGRAQSAADTIRDALHAENAKLLAAGVPSDGLPDVDRVRVDVVSGGQDAQPHTAADRGGAVLVEFCRPDLSTRGFWTSGRLRDRAVEVGPGMDALRAEMSPDERGRLLGHARQALASAHDFRQLFSDAELVDDLTEVTAHVLSTEGPEAARRFAADTARDLDTEGTSLGVRAGAGPEPGAHNSGGGSDRPAHARNSGDAASGSPHALTQALQDDAVTDPVVPHNLLGPDEFGLLAPAAQPNFLAGLDVSALSTAQLPALFDQMDLTRPTPDIITADSLDHRDDQVITVDRPADTRTDWAPGDVPPLREKLEMPKLLHTIWLGGPVVDRDSTAVVRERFGAAADKYVDSTGRPTGTSVLWTDVSRSAFEAARTTPPPADGSPDPHADVRDMMAWAREHNIRIVNIDEVFHRDSPMRLHPFFRSEVVKQVGPGWAAGSDISRFEILRAFGGIYTDGDNVVHDLALAENVVHSPEAWAVLSTSKKVLGNAAFAMPRNHPITELALAGMADKYDLLERDLYDAQVESMNKEFFDTPEMRALRFSLMARTGPTFLLKEFLPGLGYVHEPVVPAVTMHTAQSWLPGAAGERPPISDPAETVELTKKVIQTLIGDLGIRAGDLHLTAVAPVVNRHVDPDLIWSSVLRYIASRPELANQVRTVTLKRWEGGRFHDVALPASISDVLVVAPVGAKPRLGEYSWPAGMFGAGVPRSVGIEPDPATGELTDVGKAELNWLVNMAGTITAREQAAGRPSPKLVLAADDATIGLAAREMQAHLNDVSATMTSDTPFAAPELDSRYPVAGEGSQAEFTAPVDLSDVDFVPLRAADGGVVGVGFLRSGEQEVVVEAFQHGAGRPDEFTVAVHHGPDGFEVPLRSGGTARLDEDGVFRLLNSLRSMPEFGGSWVNRPLMFASCRLGSPEYADRMARLRELASDAGYGGVDGPPRRVEVRAEGVMRDLPDDEAPAPGAVVLAPHDPGDELVDWSGQGALSEENLAPFRELLAIPSGRGVLQDWVEEIRREANAAITGGPRARHEPLRVAAELYQQMNPSDTAPMSTLFGQYPLHIGQRAIGWARAVLGPLNPPQGIAGTLARFLHDRAVYLVAQGRAPVEMFDDSPVWQGYLDRTADFGERLRHARVLLNVDQDEEGLADHLRDAASRVAWRAVEESLGLAEEGAARSLADRLRASGSDSVAGAVEHAWRELDARNVEESRWRAEAERLLDVPEGGLTDDEADLRGRMVSVVAAHLLRQDETRVLALRFAEAFAGMRDANDDKVRNWREQGLSRLGVRTRDRDGRPVAVPDEVATLGAAAGFLLSAERPGRVVADEAVVVVRAARAAVRAFGATDDDRPARWRADGTRLLGAAAPALRNLDLARLTPRARTRFRALADAVGRQVLDDPATRDPVEAAGVAEYLRHEFERLREKRSSIPNQVLAARLRAFERPDTGSAGPQAGPADGLTVTQGTASVPAPPPSHRVRQELAEVERRFQDSLEAGDDRFKGDLTVEDGMRLDHAAGLLGVRPAPLPGRGAAPVEQRRLWQRMTAAVASWLDVDPQAAPELAAGMRAAFERYRLADTPGQAWSDFLDGFTPAVTNGTTQLSTSDPSTATLARLVATEMLGHQPAVAPFVGLPADHQRILRQHVVDVLASHLLADPTDPAVARAAWRATRQIRWAAAELFDLTPVGPLPVGADRAFTASEDVAMRRQATATDPHRLDAGIRSYQSHWSSLFTDSEDTRALLGDTRNDTNRRRESARAAVGGPLPWGHAGRDALAERIAAVWQDLNRRTPQLGSADASSALREFARAAREQWRSRRIAELSGAELDRAVGDADTALRADWSQELDNTRPSSARGARAESLRTTAEQLLGELPARAHPGRDGLIELIGRIRGAVWKVGGPSSSRPFEEMAWRLWTQHRVATLSGAELDDAVERVYDALAGSPWERQFGAAVTKGIGHAATSRRYAREVLGVLPPDGHVLRDELVEVIGELWRALPSTSRSDLVATVNELWVRHRIGTRPADSDLWAAVHEMGEELRQTATRWTESWAAAVRDAEPRANDDADDLASAEDLLGPQPLLSSDDRSRLFEAIGATRRTLPESERPMFDAVALRAWDDADASPTGTEAEKLDQVRRSLQDSGILIDEVRGTVRQANLARDAERLLGLPRPQPWDTSSRSVTTNEARELHDAAIAAIAHNLPSDDDNTPYGLTAYELATDLRLGAMSADGERVPGLRELLSWHDLNPELLGSRAEGLIGQAEANLPMTFDRGELPPPQSAAVPPPSYDPELARVVAEWADVLDPARTSPPVSSNAEQQRMWWRGTRFAQALLGPPPGPAGGWGSLYDRMVGAVANAYANDRLLAWSAGKPTMHLPSNVTPAAGLAARLWMSIGPHLPREDADTVARRPWAHTAAWSADELATLPPEVSADWRNWVLDRMATDTGQSREDLAEHTAPARALVDAFTYQAYLARDSADPLASVRRFARAVREHGLADQLAVLTDDPADETRDVLNDLLTAMSGPTELWRAAGSLADVLGPDDSGPLPEPAARRVAEVLGPRPAHGDPEWLAVYDRMASAVARVSDTNEVVGLVTRLWTEIGPHVPRESPGIATPWLISFLEHSDQFGTLPDRGEADGWRDRVREWAATHVGLAPDYLRTDSTMRMAVNAFAHLAWQGRNSADPFGGLRRFAAAARDGGLVDALVHMARRTGSPTDEGIRTLRDGLTSLFTAMAAMRTPLGRAAARFADVLDAEYGPVPEERTRLAEDLLGSAPREDAEWRVVHGRMVRAAAYAAHVAAQTVERELAEQSARDRVAGGEPHTMLRGLQWHADQFGALPAEDAGRARDQVLAMLESAGLTRAALVSPGAVGWVVDGFAHLAYQGRNSADPLGGLRRFAAAARDAGLAQPWAAATRRSVDDPVAATRDRVHTIFTVLAESPAGEDGATGATELAARRTAARTAALRAAEDLIARLWSTIGPAAPQESSVLTEQRLWALTVAVFARRLADLPGVEAERPDLLRWVVPDPGMSAEELERVRPAHHALLNALAYLDHLDGNQLESASRVEPFATAVRRVGLELLPAIEDASGSQTHPALDQLFDAALRPARFEPEYDHSTPAGLADREREARRELGTVADEDRTAALHRATDLLNAGHHLSPAVRATAEQVVAHEVLRSARLQQLPVQSPTLELTSVRAVVAELAWFLSPRPGEESVGAAGPVELADVHVVPLLDASGKAVGAGFLSPGEGRVVTEAFSRGARMRGGSDDYTVAVHHGERGFEVPLKSGGVRVLDERDMLRLVSSLDVADFGDWRAGSSLAFASCDLGSPAYADRLARLRALATDAGYGLPVVGPAGRVEVRARGTMRVLGDHEGPAPDAVVLAPSVGRLAPNSAAVGGLVFSADPATVDPWADRYDRLPSAPDRGFYVFAIAEGEGFLVGGQVISGVVLAEKVRSSKHYRSIAGDDPTISVTLVAENPADPDWTPWTGAQEFASALSADDPYRAVSLVSGGTVELVSRPRAEQVRWLAPLDAQGRQLVLSFDYGDYRTDYFWEAVAESTDDAQRVVSDRHGAAPGVSETMNLAPWAASFHGERTRPVRLVLRVGDGRLRTPLDDGRVVDVAPAPAADLIMDGTGFRRLTDGPVRPELLFTFDVTGSRDDAEMFRSAFFARLQERSGPWRTFDYLGPSSHKLNGSMRLPAGASFTPGRPLALDDVEHVVSGRVFGFPNSPAEKVTMHAFAAAYAKGGIDLSGLEGLARLTDRDAPVVVVASGFGTHAELTIRRGHRQRVEVDGAGLLAMLWGDREFRRLTAGELSAVVIVAADTGAQVTFGELGFDVAGALHANNRFPEVLAPTGGAWVSETAVEVDSGTGFVVVSGLRAGDLSTSVLNNKAGDPVAFWVHYQGDESTFEKATKWAQEVTPDTLKTVLTPTGPQNARWHDKMSPMIVLARRGESGYQVTGWNSDMEVTAAGLSKGIRNEKTLRQMLGTDPYRPVLWVSLNGATVGLDDIALGMLSGGYSRVMFGLAGGSLTLEEGGRLGVTEAEPGVGVRFDRIGQIKPGLAGVVSYSRVDAELGANGRYFPRGHVDGPYMRLEAQRGSRVQQCFYFREIPGEDGKKTWVPYLAPWAGRSRVLFFDSHGNKQGIVVAMRTGEPFQFGDRLVLSDSLAMEVLHAAVVFLQGLQGVPGSRPALVVRACSVNAPSDGSGDTFLYRTAQAWRSENWPLEAMWGADRTVESDSASMATQVSDEGAFTEALPPGETSPEPVPLSDFAASRVEPVVAVFVPGPSEVKKVRELVRKAVRAAAWRQRNDVELPAVVLTWYGERSRAEKVASVVQDELASEVRRMAGYGYPVRPGGIEVRMVAGAGLSSGSRVVVTVDLPARELGAAALESGDRARIREVFYRLAPDVDLPRVEFVSLRNASDKVVAVGFPRRGERETLVRAFRNGAGRADEFTVLAHHGPDGFEVSLGDDGAVHLNADDVFRLLQLRAGPGWLASAMLMFVSSRLDSDRYRHRLERLRELARGVGYRNPVQGSKGRVEARADGVIRDVDDGYVPGPNTVVFGPPAGEHRSRTDIGSTGA